MSISNNIIIKKTRLMENISIIEKPDWVSWDEIHNVIWKAHENNLSNGIIMSYPSLLGDEIKEKIGKDGKLFIALDGDKVVGTMALSKKTGKRWYCPGDYGYLCFAAVLSEYSGKGIYRLLYQLAEMTATKMGLTILTRTTNENNARMLRISKQEGYYFVEYMACKDHFNIVFVKWLNGCPFPAWYIKMKFLLSKLYLKTRYKIDSKKGRVKRFGI